MKAYQKGNHYNAGLGKVHLQSFLVVGNGFRHWSRSSLFWDVKQRRLGIVSHRNFGTTCRFHLRGSRSDHVGKHLSDRFPIKNGFK